MRRSARPAGIGMFTGALAANVDQQLPAVAGHAVRAGQGHRRQGDVRLQRSVAGIVQAADAIDSYYIIGYYSTHIATDGKFRRIKVTLERRARRASWPTARATSPTRTSRSSPRPTRSVSSKTR